MEQDIREPEIHNNEFSRLLTEYARRRDLRTFLDIGASDGRGSTAALYEGLKERPVEDNVMLYALELRENRYQLLVDRYLDVDFIYPIQGASVPADCFPTEQDVRDFWRQFPNPSAEIVEQDIVNLREDRAFQSRVRGGWAEGIQDVKLAAGVTHFDFVLIDGDHWLGEQELYRVMGAKVIALDDVQTYKNHNSTRLLGAHILYRSVHYNPAERYGFAIFERK